MPHFTKIGIGCFLLSNQIIGRKNLYNIEKKKKNFKQGYFYLKKNVVSSSKELLKMHLMLNILLALGGKIDYKI